ncbi:MAG: enoyl-CoA hydratase-related protein, partial [Gammaproteobacteria bacterium]
MAAPAIFRTRRKSNFAMAESAKFTMAYTKVGLVPDGSSSYFLARIVGLRRAKEMALLNPILSAEQAME